MSPAPARYCVSLAVGSARRHAVTCHRRQLTTVCLWHVRGLMLLCRLVFDVSPAPAHYGGSLASPVISWNTNPMGPLSHRNQLAAACLWSTTQSHTDIVVISAQTSFRALAQSFIVYVVAFQFKQQGEDRLHHERRRCRAPRGWLACANGGRQSQGRSSQAHLP